MPSLLSYGERRLKKKSLSSGRPGCRKEVEMELLSSFLSSSLLKRREEEKKKGEEEAGDGGGNINSSIEGREEAVVPDSSQRDRQKMAKEKLLL